MITTILSFSIGGGMAIGILFLMLLFIALFAIGLGPLPYIYPNEVFTIGMRPMGQSIAMLSLFFCDLGK